MEGSFTRRLFAHRGIGGKTISERRTSPRTPLLLPAKLVCVYGTVDCIVLDLSAVGALIKTASPLSVGASAYLRTGPFDIFVASVRIASRSRAYAVTGILFENRLTQAQIKELRSYGRNCIQAERRASYEKAREWWECDGD